MSECIWISRSLILLPAIGVASKPLHFASLYVEHTLA